ncbi:hypothetical protein B0H11DRAFT_1992891 [Mycena galericulata]|nr:hypothetical protein B0H11DRAFT_1992891 [Mycena galericulata]
MKAEEGVGRKGGLVSEGGSSREVGDAEEQSDRAGEFVHLVAPSTASRLFSDNDGLRLDHGDLARTNDRVDSGGDIVADVFVLVEEDGPAAEDGTGEVVAGVIADVLLDLGAHVVENDVVGKDGGGPGGVVGLDSRMLRERFFTGGVMGGRRMVRVFSLTCTLHPHEFGARGHLEGGGRLR